ncbi:hypothetical protein PGB90_010114 [Kerria lacca]
MKYIVHFICLCFIWKKPVAAVNTTFLKIYDQKVCLNEPTCSLTSSPDLVQAKLTFDGRDCMCDFECAEYNDCCEDSLYYKTSSDTKKKYYCSPNAKVYMVVSCPSTYTDAHIKDLCAKTLYPLEEDNTIIIRPVTNKNKRVTYANAYCAICNGDSDFEPWPLTAGCGEAPPGYLTSTSTTQNSINKVQNRISDSSSPSKTTPTTTSIPDRSIKLDIHFNPGALLGGNKSANAGINTEVKLPTLGLGGTSVIDKTIGSATGIFGINVKRNKRDSTLSLDFNKYASNVGEIVKNVEFDQNLKQFIAKYNGKDFICKFGSKMPANYNDYIRKCVPNMISDCPGNSEATSRCQSYTAVVYDKSNKQPYRNKDCASCNGVPLNVTTGCPSAVRTEASSLFDVSNKDSGGMFCNDPVIAEKFCSS